MLLLHVPSSRIQSTFTSAFIIFPRFLSSLHFHKEFDHASWKNCRKNLKQLLTLDATQYDSVENDTPTSSSINVQVSFSHIHLYVDTLEDISVYKELENKLNNFSHQMNGKVNVEQGQTLWAQLDSISSHYDLDSRITKNSFDYTPQNRDVVKQLLAGLGFRITAISYPSNGIDVDTRSVLITSKDPHGVKIIVSAPEPDRQRKRIDHGTTQIHHFKASEFFLKLFYYQDDDFLLLYLSFMIKLDEIERFFQNNSNRQGIATLAFEVTNGHIEELHKKYWDLHPYLISDEYRDTPLSYPVEGTSGSSVKVFEVYAYYKNEKTDTQVDRGTKLRFVQKINLKQVHDDSQNDASSDIYQCFLPGLVPVDATFDTTCMPAYFDHWVSNGMHHFITSTLHMM